MGITIFISQVILGICLFYLIFFKDYVKQKGKNFADKEDIADITNEIESVKKVFTTENEILKSKLQVIQNNQIQQLTDERNSIIKFYDDWSNWINYSADATNVGEYNKHNYEELMSKIRNIQESYTKTSLNCDRLELLIDDKDITAYAYTLTRASLEYHIWVVNLLVAIQVRLQSQNFYYHRFLKLAEKDGDNAAELKQIAEEDKKLKDEIMGLQKEYYNNSLNRRKPVMEEKAKFLIVVKKFFDLLSNS